MSDVVQPHALSHDRPPPGLELEGPAAHGEAEIRVLLALGRDVEQDGGVLLGQWEIAVDLAVWMCGWDSAC